MWKVTRVIVKRFWGLLALLLFCLAMTVAVGRQLAPKVGEYSEEIATYLSKKLNLQVQIGNLQAEWSGLSPEIQVENLQLKNIDGKNLFTLGEVSATLDLLRTLFSFQPKWKELSVDRVKLALVEDENGNWQLPNFETSNSETSINLDDILQLSDRMALHNAELDITFSHGHNTLLTFPNLLVESRGSFHRFSTEVSVDQRQEVLRFVMEAEGDISDVQNFTAKGYLKLQNFELDRALTDLPGEFWARLPDQEWRKGDDLNMEVWFDIFTGGHMTARGSLNVGEVPVSTDSKFSPPTNTHGQFVFQWRDLKAWDLSLNKLQFSWGDVQSPELDLFLSSPDLGSKVDVYSPYLNLGEWKTTLLGAEFFPENVINIIDTLNPTGAIKDMVLSLDASSPADASITFNLDDVGINPFKGVPGLKKVSGYLESSVKKGFLELNSLDGFSMYYAQTYEQPFFFDQAKGQVNWSIGGDNDTLHLYSGLLSVNGALAQGLGYFSLDTPLKKNTGISSEMMLHLNIQNVDAINHDQIVPYKTPQSLRDWLAKSVKAGHVPSGGFIYRGGINAETVRHASIQMNLKFEDAYLEYHPDWPELKQATGELWLDDSEVSATVSSAKLLKSSLGTTKVRVFRNDNRQELIELQGGLSGTGQDGLEFLTTTPVRDQIGDQLDSWTLDGNIKTEFDLLIPLPKEKIPEVVSQAQVNPGKSDNVEVVAVNGRNFSENPVVEQRLNESTGVPMHREKLSVHLDGVDLRIDQYDLDLENMVGELRYQNDKGVFFEQIKANFLQKPTVLTMAPQDKVDPAMRMGISGEVELSVLGDWTRRPELKFMQGETKFIGQLTLPSSGDQSVQLKIESELEGIEIDLPAPYAKLADQVKPFLLNASFSERSSLYDIRYDKMQGLFELKNGSFHNGSIGIDAKSPTIELQKDPQLFVQGRVEYLDWAEWQGLYDKYQGFVSAYANESTSNLSSSSEAGSGLPVAFDLHMQEFNYSDQPFFDLAVAGKQGNGFWLFSVQSPLLGGDITWFEDSKAATVVDLEYLSLPESEESEATQVLVEGDEVNNDVLKDFDPNSIPPIDFTTEKFSVGDDHYGRWSFQMRPIEDGVQLTNIIGEVRGGRIAGLPIDQEQEIVEMSKSEGIGNQGAGVAAELVLKDQLASEVPQESQTGAFESLGASLEWTKVGDQVNTIFKGRFETDSPTEVFEQWQQPQAFDSESAIFQANLSWSASPTGAAIPLLNGDIGVRLKNGEFFQSDNGASTDLLKLFALFNFDTWARRLRFDFADLYGNGLDFDRVDGRIMFENNMAFIVDPIVVESPSSRMQLAGSIDLTTFEIDGTLVARLPVGENLTWVALLAGGLPAAAGTYLVSKLFKRQVDKLASLSYSVKGTINEPNMKFDRMFDRDAAERQGKETEENLNKEETVEP